MLIYKYRTAHKGMETYQIHFGAVERKEETVEMCYFIV
jgi:hypothetical protein